MHSELVTGPVACINDKSVPCKWYGLKINKSRVRVPMNILSICEYCTNINFDYSEVYTDTEEYTSCNVKTMLCNYTRRYIRYSGFQLNINSYHPSYDWDFVISPLQNSKPGVMNVALCADTYWLLVIRLDPKFDLGNGSYYMKCSMKSVSGKSVDMSGHDYIPLASNVIHKISGYNSSVQSRFQYSDQSRLEDNTFVIIIDLYEIVDDIYTFKRTIPITLNLELLTDYTQITPN